MEQRRELSRLVHGLDNVVLDLFFAFDPETVERLAGTYGRLFGPEQEDYLRDTWEKWKSEEVGVSGMNAARLMMVVPYFLDDAQREALLEKLYAIAKDRDLGLWIYGEASLIADVIKTFARPDRSWKTTLKIRPSKLPPLHPPGVSGRDRPPIKELHVETEPDPVFVHPGIIPSPTAQVQNPAIPPRAPVAGSPVNPVPIIASFGCIAGVIIFVVLVLAIAGSHQTSSPAYSYAPASASSPPAASTVPRLELPPYNPRGPYKGGGNQSPSTPPGFYPGTSTPSQPTPPQPKSLEIFYVRKPNRTDEHITYVGGKNPDGTVWGLSQADAIAGILNSKYSFYVTGGSTRVSVLVAKSPAGNWMLKTERDGKHANNLLSLPDFPK